MSLTAAGVADCQMLCAQRHAQTARRSHACSLQRLASTLQAAGRRAHRDSGSMLKWMLGPSKKHACI